MGLSEVSVQKQMREDRGKAGIAVPLRSTPFGYLDGQVTSTFAFGSCHDLRVQESCGPGIKPGD